MRPLRLLAGACALAAASASLAARADCPPDTGDCQALLETGTQGSRIDLVILGDGYTEAERDKFYADAQTATTKLFDSETYGLYKGLFNVYALFTPSAESGADHPSLGIDVDTVFESTYENGGVPHALVANYILILGELKNRFPERDLALLLVNDTEYGGTGGPVAVVSLHADSHEIIRHELGHTLGGLADEYTFPLPGYPEGDPEPNVASVENLDPVKWDMWLTPGVAIPTPAGAANGPHDPIGAFEGARYLETGIFRPASNCLMRELTVTFCPVCSEAMVKSFHQLSVLIDAKVPASPAAIPAKGPTQLTAAFPEIAGLSFTWSIDGEPIADSAPALALDPSERGLADGPHEVTLTVTDPTPLVRNDPDGVMAETFTWQLEVDSKLPPVGGAGGSGGSGGGGEGGDGGNQGGGCGCRSAGEPPGPAAAWLLFGAAALAEARRRRGSRA